MNFPNFPYSHFPNFPNSHFFQLYLFVSFINMLYWEWWFWGWHWDCCWAGWCCECFNFSQGLIPSYILWIGPCVPEHYANSETLGNSSKTMLETLSHKQFEARPSPINNFVVIDALSLDFEFPILNSDWREQQCGGKTFENIPQAKKT